MKQHLFSTLSTMLVVLVTVGSETCNRPPESGVECSFLVSAKDYSGLDGCGILLEQADGRKLLATNLSQYAPAAREGDVMRISYEKQDGMMSVCMAEKSIVRITCYQLVSKATGCPDMVDPYRVAWASRVMSEMDPRQVELLYVADQKSYRFTSQDEVGIYTCEGDVLCIYPIREREKCKDILDQVRDAKIIYVVNE
jgi:hypothetical protein